MTALFLLLALIVFFLLLPAKYDPAMRLRERNERLRRDRRS